MVDYVARLPGGLRRALAAGRWLPIVGAGLSATAATEDHQSPPGWKKLAEGLASDLAGPSSGSPIDVLSSYADAYGRAHLVERLSELLLVSRVEPGDAHTKFAQLPFDIVVTTNFDFLLERAYERQRRPCVPLIGESQLSIPMRVEATYLLKFHGDLYHPEALVATEEDYDGFVRRNPLLATYISWWLLTREPVFVGYSLDDADLREILALLRERLGRMTRPTWAILAADPDGEASKFERRGIKPIVLDPNPEADRAVVLAQFFDQLRSHWEDEIADQIEARTDATTAELRRVPLVPQLALFLASRPLTALYREFVFPSVPHTGLLPLTLDDVRAQDRARRPMAIDMALSEAAVVVYDRGRGNALPLDYVQSRRGSNPVVVVDAAEDARSDQIPVVLRPSAMDQWPPFVTLLQGAIEQHKSPVNLQQVSEQLKDLERSKPDQVLLTCLALLEAQLRTVESSENLPSVIPTSGGRMERLRIYFGNDFDTVIKAVGLRHQQMQNLEVDHNEVADIALKIKSIAETRQAIPA